ncbi:MAG: hypothetical protein LBT86_09920 [Deltaproteobacteria bacterium]|jgi:hypothetical protein|nr:hypothetical protein [Deltaproteobacteria bacterium]
MPHSIENYILTRVEKLREFSVVMEEIKNEFFDPRPRGSHDPSDEYLDQQIIQLDMDLDLDLEIPEELMRGAYLYFQESGP